jgi:hypothetical protein
MFNKNKKAALLAALALFSGLTQAAEFRYRYILSDQVPYDWKDSGDRIEDWQNVGAYYQCTNWSPSTATIGKGISFTQTATDCQQNQERMIYPQQKDSRTGKIQDIPGAEYKDARVISTTHTQDEVGILEKWEETTPTYTTWEDTNALYGCTSWSPDPSSISSNTTITQSTSTCSTDQQRSRQDREQEFYTEEIRDIGALITENQTLKNLTATRAYNVTFGDWANSGALSCGSYSPSTASVNYGQSFTQTSSCQQPQSRSRNESYVDVQSGSTVAMPVKTETKNVATSSTRSAVGTYQNWVSSSSSYSSWSNSSSVYGCSSWSPDPGTVTYGQVFTQSGSGCVVNQTRTRTDYQYDTVTGATRYAGSATESQVVGASDSRSATGTLQSWVAGSSVYSAWTNSSAVYGCTSWTPDPSSVQEEQGYFTQTGTGCYVNQTRTRQDRLYNTTTGAYQNNGGAVTETQVVGGQVDYRQALGTRPHTGGH